MPAAMTTAPSFSEVGARFVESEGEVGLLTSMLLNMIVVPALHLRFGRPVEAD